VVKNGDRIRLDVPARKLELLVGVAELNARRKKWRKPAPRPEDRRGYRKLFLESVTQADRGCDFDFLSAPATTSVPRNVRTASGADNSRTRRKNPKKDRSNRKKTKEAAQA